MKFFISLCFFASHQLITNAFILERNIAQYPNDIAYPLIHRYDRVIWSQSTGISYMMCFSPSVWSHCSLNVTMNADLCKLTEAPIWHTWFRALYSEITFNKIKCNQMHPAILNTQLEKYGNNREIDYCFKMTMFWVGFVLTFDWHGLLGPWATGQTHKLPQRRGIVLIHTIWKWGS